MGGTALKRKARRNKAKSQKRNHMLKVQAFKPVIKSIDVEAIKEEFAKKSTTNVAKTEKEKPVKEEVPAAEEVVAAATPGAPAKEKASKPAKAKKPAAKKAEIDEPKAEKKAPVKKSAPKAKKEETTEV